MTTRIITRAADDRPRPMHNPQSFTGRKRRLTNRWSVWLADRLAQAFITVGGVGTIVAVLTVFVFLLYVALPLFKPARLTAERTTSLPNSDNSALCLLVDESGIFQWSILSSGEFELRRADTPDSEIVLSRKLVNDDQLTHIAASREDLTFAVANKSGKVALGKFEVRTQFKSAANTPPEHVNLGLGKRVPWNNGVLERTPQGMLREQSVGVEVGEFLDFSTAPLVHLDFATNSPQATSLAGITGDGKVLVAEVAVTDNILTGDKQITLGDIRSLPIPTGDAPWRIHFMGRGDEVVVLWKNGRLQRYGSALQATPKLLEDINVGKKDGVELTASLVLQEKYTLLLGDAAGNLSAWFTARDADDDKALAKLRCGHVLPSLNAGITALDRSSQMRMVVVGTAQGDVAVYHVTTEQRLALIPQALPAEVKLIALSPHDEQVLARDTSSSWQGLLAAEHPEASLSALFRPVWYEGYDRPLHKWQSTAGTNGPEPKFGIWPLIFGTLKATFYSMLLGTPIAILAAVYTSEFVEPGYKAYVKSSIELMATIPSVVLGFLAGLVLAPLAESFWPSILLSVVIVPFMFLLGSQLWQILPHKVSLQLASWRLLILAGTLVLGITIAAALGPGVEAWLFQGNFKRWLEGSSGSGTGGWFLLLLPLSAALTSFVVNAKINPEFRQRFGSWRREMFAFANLIKFLLATLAACLVAYLGGVILTTAGVDVRGGLFDSFQQKNSLVVGFVMGFAIIPIIYTISEDALSTVPNHLRSASLGCGATPWQTTWRVVIPTAASGLFSAIMVGLGRAIGETMIMLMATGNVPITEINMFSGFRSLSANIAEELPESTAWSTHFRLLFFTGLLLLVLTFFINTSAELVRISFRRRTRQL